MKLTLQLPRVEHFNDDTQTFSVHEAKEVVIEHSLYTISLWEEKFHKPFLGENEKTKEEMMWYIIICSDFALTISDLGGFTPELNDKLSEFFRDQACATVINETPSKNAKGNTYGRKRQTPMTAELIYWEMIRFGIPFECQHWHINKLLTLIRICALKEQEENSGGKNKMPAMNTLKSNSSINAARRAAMNSKG